MTVSRTRSPRPAPSIIQPAATEHGQESRLASIDVSDDGDAEFFDASVDGGWLFIDVVVVVAGWLGAEMLTHEAVLTVTANGAEMQRP